MSNDGRAQAGPIITAQSASQRAVPGQNAVFSVTANADPAPAYQWQRQPIGSASWNNLGEDLTYTGTGTANLTVSPVGLAMNGDIFQCVVSNTSGSVTSTPVALVVGAPLVVCALAGQNGVPGSADGTGTAAQFNGPSALAIDSAGNLYVTDTDNCTIREITSGGAVTTLAGQAGLSGSTDATGTGAQFNNPAGIAVDGAGNVYVADTGNQTIRMIAAGGVVTTLAGQVGVSGSTDATGTGAQFNNPAGIAVDGAGNVYVADTGNQTIRMIAAGGVVTTLAGQVGVSGSTDATGTGAQFFGPQGLAADSAGNLYVADAGNDDIRKVVISTGVVTTVAGLAGVAGTDDGPGGLARFFYPSGLSVDAAGILYVADTGSNTIREIAVSGAVSTIAGQAGTNGSANGVGVAALFYYPAGIVADNAGNIYIADTDNLTIRAGKFLAAPTILIQPQNVTSSIGGAVQFSVTATGGGVLTYQWYLNGGAISAATSNILSVGNAQLTNAGDYTVTVANNAGIATGGPASLAVLSLSIATNVLTGTVSLENGGTGGTTGSIFGSGALTFAAGGSDQSITLAPTGGGGVYFGSSSAYFAYSGQRFSGDGLIASLPSAGPVGMLEVHNPSSGSFAALTEFAFGHTLSFSNSHSELELHAFNGGWWQPVGTFIGFIGDNQFQLRDTGDTNSLILEYDDLVGYPVIRNEFAGTNLGIAPTKNLMLSFSGVPSAFLTANQAGGGLYLGAFGTNTDIRMAPSGTGRFVINGNSIATGSMHAGADVETGNPAGGQQAPWKLGSYTGTGAVQIGVNGIAGQLPVGTAVRQGTAVLSAGVVSISDPLVKGTTRIILGSVTPAGAPGALYVSKKTPGTGFSVKSTSSSDNSRISYLEIDP